jgi:SAM-dependent methyltransferase
MAELTDLWNNPSFLRDVQYRTDANLAARQSIYAYQHPRIDLPARVIDLASPAPGATVADVGCGNGAYLAELAGRGFAGRVLGLDMSPGMLAAARDRLASAGPGDSARSGVAAPVGAAALDGVAAPVGAAPPEPAGSPGVVALIAADATALPLPDGVADLTLAMHMLYHVPDPSQAVRELLRITRPGGRVVIGLNGRDHLRQLRDAVAAARADGTRGSQRERVTLDDGEALTEPHFSSVTRHDFVSELRLPEPGPIVDYVRSMLGTQHAADPERLVAAVASGFAAAPGAVLTITTHTGCLVCHV